MANSDLETSANHQVWPAERIGDLLVIRPTGDLVGFQSSIFQSEYQRVLRLAESPRIRNVLIDLSQSKYFGSEMIGALVRLRNAVAESARTSSDDDGTADADSDETDKPAPAARGGDVEAGGVTALSNVSPDMRAGLSVMNVDSLMMIFDTREEAVQKLAHISARERFTRFSRVARLPLLVLLLIGIGFLVFSPAFQQWVFRPSAEDDLAEVKVMEKRWRRQFNTKLTEGDLARAGERLRDDFVWITRRYGKSWLTPAHGRVLLAADNLMGWMADPRNDRLEKEFVTALTAAEDAVRDELENGVPEPRGPTRVTDTAKPSRQATSEPQKAPDLSGGDGGMRSDSRGGGEPLDNGAVIEVPIGQPETADQPETSGPAPGVADGE